MVSDSVGLCVSGCPPDQVLTIETETDPSIVARVPEAMRQCQERFKDITDEAFVVQSRIKACVYDLAVSGDDTVSKIWNLYQNFNHLAFVKI